MNLDDLVNSIPEDKLKAELTRWVNDWKSDNADVENLLALIEKWHGNVWFSDQQAQEKFYNRFQKFKEQAIQNIRSMTVNERLYWFGLFDLWDASDDELRERIRTKLHAHA